MTAESVPSGPLSPVGTTATRDLVDGFLQWHLWLRLGWLEVKRRYRRTVVGPFWGTLSLAVLIAALGAVGAGLWNQKLEDYLPFLAAGIIVWTMISTMITESGTLFVSSSNLFRQMQFNYSVLAYALVYRNFILFVHNLSIYLVVLLIFGANKFSPVMLLAVPALALLLINGVWAALLVGMFCLRYRDLQQLITSLIQISMFVTPIFWPPSSLSGRSRIVFIDFNPLYHFVEIVRAPLLGEVPAVTTWIAVAIITVVGWGVTFTFFNRFRKRIAYWS